MIPLLKMRMTMNLLCHRMMENRVMESLVSYDDLFINISKLKRSDIWVKSARILFKANTNTSIDKGIFLNDTYYPYKENFYDYKLYLPSICVYADSDLNHFACRNMFISEFSRELLIMNNLYKEDISINSISIQLFNNPLMNIFDREYVEEITNIIALRSRRISIVKCMISNYHKGVFYLFEDSNQSELDNKKLLLCLCKEINQNVYSYYKKFCESTPNITKQNIYASFISFLKKQPELKDNICITVEDFMNRQLNINHTEYYLLLEKYHQYCINSQLEIIKICNHFEMKALYAIESHFVMFTSFHSNNLNYIKEFYILIKERITTELDKLKVTDKNYPEINEDLLEIEKKIKLSEYIIDFLDKISYSNEQDSNTTSNTKNDSILFQKSRIFYYNNLINNRYDEINLFATEFFLINENIKAKYLDHFASQLNIYNFKLLSSISNTLSYKFKFEEEKILDNVDIKLLKYQLIDVFNVQNVFNSKNIVNTFEQILLTNTLFKKTKQLKDFNFYYKNNYCEKINNYTLIVFCNGYKIEMSRKNTMKYYHGLSYYECFGVADGYMQFDYQKENLLEEIIKALNNQNNFHFVGNDYKSNCHAYYSLLLLLEQINQMKENNNFIYTGQITFELNPVTGVIQSVAEKIDVLLNKINLQKPIIFNGIYDTINKESLIGHTLSVHFGKEHINVAKSRIIVCFYDGATLIEYKLGVILPKAASVIDRKHCHALVLNNVRHLSKVVEILWGNKVLVRPINNYTELVEIAEVNPFKHLHMYYEFDVLNMNNLKSRTIIPILKESTMEILPWNIQRLIKCFLPYHSSLELNIQEEYEDLK